MIDALRRAMDDSAPDAQCVRELLGNTTVGQLAAAHSTSTCVHPAISGLGALMLLEAGSAALPSNAVWAAALITPAIDGSFGAARTILKSVHGHTSSVQIELPIEAWKGLPPASLRATLITHLRNRIELWAKGSDIGMDIHRMDPTEGPIGTACQAFHYWALRERGFSGPTSAHATQVYAAGRKLDRSKEPMRVLSHHEILVAICGADRLAPTEALSGPVTVAQSKCMARPGELSAPFEYQSEMVPPIPPAVQAYWLGGASDEDLARNPLIRVLALDECRRPDRTGAFTVQLHGRPVFLEVSAAGDPTILSAPRRGRALPSQAPRRSARLA